MIVTTTRSPTATTARNSDHNHVHGADCEHDSGHDHEYGHDHNREDYHHRDDHQSHDQ